MQLEETIIIKGVTFIQKGWFSKGNYADFWESEDGIFSIIGRKNYNDYQYSAHKKTGYTVEKDFDLAGNCVGEKIFDITQPLTQRKEKSIFVPDHFLDTFEELTEILKQHI